MRASASYTAPSGMRPRFRGKACGMCNLYNITTTQQAVLEWVRAMRDLAGNFESSFDIYPNQPGPVVRKGADGQRELAACFGACRRRRSV